MNEKEQQQRRRNAYKYLTYDSNLSSRFSKIAGTKVSVYNDRALQFPVLFWKGKRITDLVHGDSSGEHKKVREHFRRLRAGGGRATYDDVWANLDKNKAEQDRKWKDVKEEIKEETCDMHKYFFGYGKRSVVIDGGKNE